MATTTQGAIPYLYIRLAILQFIQFFTWGSWFVTAGTYFMQTLDFSGQQVGMIYGTPAIAATVTPFFLGYLSDRLFSADRLLVFLHGLGGLLLYSLAQLESFAWFYGIVLLYTFCFLPTFTLANVLCLHHLADAKRDFPKVRVWGAIGWISAGVLVGLLKIEAVVTPLYIAASSSIFLAIYALSLPNTPPQGRVGPGFLALLRSDEMSTLLNDRNFRVIVIAVGLICIPSAYYYSFVNPFLNEVGVENAAGKMALGQITELVLMLALPWLFGIWRLKTLLFLGLLAWGVRYLCFVIGLNYASESWYMLGVILHGPAYIFAILTAQIYLDTRVPVSLRGTAQGFFTLLTNGLGALLGTYLAGASVSSLTLADNTKDWATIWLLPACFGITTAMLFWWQFKGRHKA